MMRVVVVVCVWASLVASRLVTAAAGLTKTLRRPTLTAHGAACESETQGTHPGGGGRGKAGGHMGMVV